MAGDEVRSTRLCEGLWLIWKFEGTLTLGHYLRMAALNDNQHILFYFKLKKIKINNINCSTGTLPNIRNTLNKKSTRHSGPIIAANSVE